jgi:predicted GNAT family N-acyltransferase
MKARLNIGESDFFVPVAAFQPRDVAFKIARSPAEIEGFWQLRREIFCEEQKIFNGTDRDEHDRNIIPIVSLSLVMGMEDEVVGVVRIDEREPGVWWGSRLGVHRDFRSVRRLSSSVAIRNRQPSFYGQRSIGAGLIYKAVSTAQALGCHTFLAQVQQQNAAFFQRLHWRRLGEVELHGITHVEMEADLDHYPPAKHDITALQVA